MNSATRSVAVVATRLPNIDRRALSQAWFSALHFAQPATAGGVPPKERSALAGGGVMRRPAATGATPGAPAAAAAAVARSPRMPAANSALGAVERRQPAGDIGRRIERALTRRVAGAPAQRTFAVDVGAGRVHVFVRTDGGTTRIIALCAPHLRERVDRALAQARYGLAAAGFAVEVAR